MSPRSEEKPCCSRAIEMPLNARSSCGYAMSSTRFGKVNLTPKSVVFRFVVIARKARASKGAILGGKKHFIQGCSIKLLAESINVEKLSNETAAATFRLASTGSMTASGLSKEMLAHISLMKRRSVDC